MIYNLYSYSFERSLTRFYHFYFSDLSKAHLKSDITERLEKSLEFRLEIFAKIQASILPFESLEPLSQIVTNSFDQLWPTSIEQFEEESNKG